MEGGGVAIAVDDDTLAERRRSLASQMEEMASDGAFLRAIQQKSPHIAVCRTILHKPTGRRTLEDIHADHSGASRSDASVHLTFLGPGDTFGERALLSSSDVRAGASVLALQYLLTLLLVVVAKLVFINRVVFAELLKESHDADSNANTLEISKRFRSNKDIVRNIFLRSSSQRSEKDLKFAVEYLKSVKFFSRFSFEVRKQLCKVMRLISSVSNTVLFEEGQVGRHFYIIFTGCVDVSVHIKNRFEETTESVVSRRGEGDYFGELALSQADGVRRATVVCTDFCELLVLGRDQYEPLIKKYQNEYHAQYAQMLRKNPYFVGPEWDDNTIEGMCSVMAEKYIPFKGEICKQVRQQPRCKFNDIFVRDYSILAESPMKILVLSRFDIFHLMSAEARASLQRSSNGYIRESIPSRALKSVAWDKYKKAFLSSVLAEKHQQRDNPFSGGRGSAGPSNVVVLEGDSRRNGVAGSDQLHTSSTTTALGLSPSGRLKLPSLPQGKLSEDGSSESSPGQQRVVGASALSKRRSIPEAADSRGSPSEKPLALPGVSPLKPEAVAEVSASSSGGFRYDLRRCGRVRTDKAESALTAARNAPAGAPTASLWDPVHGVCQPFAVLGFMMETLLRPVSQGTSSSSSSSSSKPKNAKSVAEQLRQVAATTSVASHLELTRFRVLGKFRDVNDALDLFRRVCAVERTADIADGRDCSRFAIYKEDEMTLALENFPSADAAVSEQFSAADLAHATGQRFACVGVILPHSDGASVESVAVHVYQCFPTPQSAVRFARQVAATLLAPGALSVVPLFEWIPLAELERFDARNADLEQELEQLMRRGAREDGGSTWKARKDALKKGRRPLTGSASRDAEQEETERLLVAFDAGATFREAVAMGFFEGSVQEARRLAYSLRDDFHGDAYNLFTKNCNTYADALCQLLLGKSIPAYVNRAAYFGSFLSCLMPADAADQAPVGDPNVPPRRAEFIYTPFAGAVRKRKERGAMGKAASPTKKNSAHCGGRESSSRSIAFDGPESGGGGALTVVPRVKSTIASRETATHLAFAKRLSTSAALDSWLSGVCARKDDFVYAPTSHYLRVLNDHCQWDRDARSAVLVVVGQPGTGKSALLANWAEQRRRSERGARELIYEHYSGCSYDSVKLSLFLFRFMHQLKISYNLRDFELPREHEEEKLKFSFSRQRLIETRSLRAFFRDCGGDRIVLVLDGIDCMRTEDGGDSLSWLPNTFPAGVRIIVSTTQTSAKGKSQLRCCSSVVRQPAVYDTEYLYEEKRSRELDPEEKRLILAARGSSNPLYVRLLLNALELFESSQSEQRRRWLERACESNQLNVIYELLMKQWNAMLLKDLVLELNDCRASLDAPSSSNNGVVTSSVSNDSALDHKAGDVETLQIAIEQRALLVRHTLSLLAVTRYGLSENDFVRLFGDGVSRSVCQQLLVLLRPHLMQIRRYDCGPSTHTATPSSSSNQDSKEGDAIVLYDLSHNQLRLLARYGFLHDDQLRHCYYRELAVYFDAMDACQRRVDELPVQLERCAMWSVLQSALVNMKMFQLWWSERNRQEFFSYWMVLSANCSVHDPVDDFIRSLDEFIVHEDPSAEQLLSLFLTITEFLRTWQKVDDSRASNLVLNRPSPPQLQEFISSLGNFSLANLSEDEAKRVQKEIEALCIHPGDGYYVRRWIWTQFPLIGLAFETRVFHSAAFGRSPEPCVDEEAASGSRGDSAGPETGGQAESSSQSQAMGNPNALPKALNDKGAASKKAPRGSAGVVLPKGLGVAGEKATKSLVPGKRRPLHKTPSSLALDSVAEGEIGALEFLSVESSEGSLGSVSKLEVCTCLLVWLGTWLHD
ncbi:hypothetical protein BBJ28_00006870 [Nothophytophthora sp. Chile5]|nr:hypothetical protein BBJ28_00006870 [Nothophytophthora sp. Chile5]